MGQTRQLKDVLGYRPVVDERLKAAFGELGRRWPPDLFREGIWLDRQRLLEHVSLVRDSGGSLLDIGGGYCPFGMLCAALGLDVAIVDNYAHELFGRADLPSLLADYGVVCRKADVVRDPLPFEDACFDIVTSFDSLEHWHHSPRGLFSEIRRVLRPGGLFVLGVPNAVNLRKRVTVLFGKNNWSHFVDWYEPVDFHGHVREPTLSDLALMVPDLDLDAWTVFGRNWLGYYGSSRRRAVTMLVDHPLRLRPSLCADIYLVGRRAG